MEKRLTKQEKKQLWIFVAAAFGLPLLMGVLMGINFYRGADVSAFPNAQMYYPAAGVMLAVLLTRKPEEKVPVKFYAGFLTLTGILMALCVVSLFLPQVSMAVPVNCVLIVGSLISWVLLLLEKKEIRRKYGLSWGRGVRNASGTQGEARQGIRPWLWILLFLFLYFLRIFLNYVIEGMPGAFFPPFANPYVWLNFALLPLNFFMVYTAFFGEEYGWRGFFQPILQKRYGKRLGVLILGVCWGLWHLPLNLFYYSPDTWLQSVLTQQTTCIGLGIFFGLVMMKTKNIWVVVIMHFLNNNLIAVIAGTGDVISGQVIRWIDVLLLLVLNGVLFASFILAKDYRKEKRLESWEPGKETEPEKTLEAEKAAEYEGKTEHEVQNGSL